jgi:hypothetical protein
MPVEAIATRIRKPSRSNSVKGFEEKREERRVELHVQALAVIYMLRAYGDCEQGFLLMIRGYQDPCSLQNCGGRKMARGRGT